MSPRRREDLALVDWARKLEEIVAIIASEVRCMLPCIGITPGNMLDLSQVGQCRPPPQNLALV